jgi:FkbM family methyltransferase
VTTIYRNGRPTLRFQVISAVSRRLDSLIYTQRHGLIAGLRRRGGLGFVPGWLLGQSLETPELRFLGALSFRDQVVYDVGAFHGLLTLYFARTARLVVAFEPNPASRARLLENVRLNGFSNVVVRDVGAGAEPGEFELVIDRRLAGTATADAALAADLSHRSAAVERVRAAVVRLDDEVAAGRVPPPDFVKVDTEGFELAVLRGMPDLLKTRKPALYLEMHGAGDDDKRARVAAIIDALASFGYTEIVHVESGTAIAPSNAAVAREGHLFCRAPGGASPVSALH